MNTEEKKQSRLTKKQKRNIIIVIIVLAVMVLADFVWSNTYIEVKKLSAHFDNLPEGFSAMMSIPNLIALFLMSGTVAKLVKDYFAKEKKKN